MSSETNQYWKHITEITGTNNIKPSFRRYFKNDVFFSKLFTLRLGHEAFLKKSIVKLSKSIEKKYVKVLDIGCGWGVSFASNNNIEVYGVDIEGFPKDVAIVNGYKDATFYNADGSIPYPNNSFDTFFLIFVNAHITDSIFSNLLKQGINKLRDKNSTFFLIVEVDNEAISYRIMRKFWPKKLTQLIQNQDHINFKNEKSLDIFLSNNSIEVTNKEVIHGNMLAFVTYDLFWFGKNTWFSKNKVLPLFVDFFTSLIDNLMTLLGLAKEGKRHIIGYTCRVTK